MRLSQFLQSIVMAMIALISFACAPDSSVKAKRAIYETSGAIQGSESTLDECSRRFSMLRDTVLQQTCASIESHIQEMEARLEVLCKDAGEKVYGSVDNVEGLYVHFPKEWVEGLRYYHEDDRFVHSFLSPQMGRHYTFVEMDSPRKVGMIDHSQAEIHPNPPQGRFLIETPMKQITEPEARYEITWKSLTDKEDLRHGLYGDELTILDFKTKEVLASRKFFFYVVQDGTIDKAGQALRTPGLNTPYRFATCKNYNPGYDDRYIDKRPRDSYRFVAKVLRPKVMPRELAAHVFDLAWGSGQKRKGCGISVRLGPGIVATDLQLSQVDPVSLRITLKGTNDSLACDSLWNDSAERSVVMFYDGSKMKLADLLKTTDRDSSPGSVGTNPLDAGSVGTNPLDIGDAELHAIGVYEGNTHKNGKIRVRVSRMERPIVLFLSAYESVEWVIEYEQGVSVRGIILRGYHGQTVSGLPRSKFLFSASSYDEGSAGSSYRFLGYKNPEFENNVKQLFGRAPTTAYAQYRGEEFVITRDK